MRLTTATVKTIGWVLSAIGIAIFVTHQYLYDFHPEVAQNALYILAFTLLVFGIVFYAVATELIKRQNNKSQPIKK
jgi:hypothetical protein